MEPELKIIIGTIVMLFIFCALAIYGCIGWSINNNGGPATENTYKMCVGEDKEVYQINGVFVNACKIKDCNQKFDGITYCTERVFIVCGNDFCARSWDD